MFEVKSNKNSYFLVIIDILYSNRLFYLFNTKKGWVILADLKQNGEALDSFIYKDKKYSDRDLDINRANRVLNEYFNK